MPPLSYILVERLDSFGSFEDLGPVVGSALKHSATPVWS